MIEYARALYQGWCRGQTHREIAQGKDNFIYLCSRIMSRTEDEIRQELEKETWFIQG